MADLVVACLECKKKFKPKTDVRGKKIKCPFCKAPINVPAAKEAKPDKKEEDAKANPEPAAAAKKTEAYDEFDDNPDPYGIKNVPLVPRCPNCTEEMGAHDVICLACGYNTLTREWGSTKRIAGLTFGRHLLYLLPALGAALFTVLSIIALIFNDVLGPTVFTDPLFAWLDHESMRLFSTVMTLSMAFSAGVYCFKKFITNPKPDEIVIE